MNTDRKASICVTDKGVELERPQRHRNGDHIYRYIKVFETYCDGCSLSIKYVSESKEVGELIIDLTPRNVRRLYAALQPEIGIEDHLYTELIGGTCGVLITHLQKEGKFEVFDDYAIADKMSYKNTVSAFKKAATGSELTERFYYKFRLCPDLKLF